MKNIFSVLVLAISAAVGSAQLNNPVIVPSVPPGSCSSQLPLWVSAGVLYTCSGGVPAALTAGTGVTSIAWTLPAFMSASPTTISAGGSQTFSFNSQAANLFLASPSGASGSPTFRALANADFPSTLAPVFSAANLTSFPTLNQPTTGNAATATALSTTGSNGTFWGVSGGAQGYYTPSGSGTVNSGTAYSPAYYPSGGGTQVSGVTPFTGLAYFSTSAIPAAATAAQVVGVIGSTAVTNATNATAMPASGLSGTSLPVGITTASGLTTAAGGAFGTGAYATIANYLTTATAASTYEPVLGNPSTNGYVLSSTTAGVRSWIASGGSMTWPTQTNYYPIYAGSSAWGTSHLDDGVTTTSTITSTETLASPGYKGTGSGPATMQFPVVSYSTLNAAYPCSSTYAGMHATVNDAPTDTWGATIASGGGGYTEPAFCNGSAWVVK